MPLKTWPVAALGLGSLLLLIALSSLASSRKAQDIYAQLDQLDTHHRLVETNLRSLRSDVNLSGVFVRDYLLDVARERGPGVPRAADRVPANQHGHVAELETLTGRDDRIQSLQRQARRVLADLRSAVRLDAGGEDSPERRVPASRGRAAARRGAGIAQEIEELNNANVAAQKAEVARRQEAFRDDLRRLLWQTVLLGLAVAVIVVLRLRVLERRSEEAEAERAQMRELSQQLVDTQEEERKNLSRELHDHVAQVLTGLRMELGGIERTSGAPRVAAAVAECRTARRRHVPHRARSGARPAPEHARRLRSSAGARMARARLHAAAATWTSSSRWKATSTSLPDKHRTCVYRVIQEALTNCARHAQATTIGSRGKPTRASCRCR